LEKYREKVNGLINSTSFVLLFYELPERITCEGGICVVPGNKPLDKEVLQMVSDGKSAYGLGPLCVNCIRIKRIDASLNEKIEEMLKG
jgi:hypothetical protein